MRIYLSAIGLSVIALAAGIVLLTSAQAGRPDTAGNLIACDPAGISGPAFFDTAVPYPIPDASGGPGEVHGCFTIDDPGIINQVNVGLGIAHTWVGDLIVTLTHEDTGTSVVLIDRPGVPEPPAGFGCSGDDIAVVVTDKSTFSLEDVCEPQPPAISGTWAPHEPLAAFIGEGIAGTWTLTVSDNSSVDTGTLDSWALIAAELKDPTATPTSMPSSTPSSTPTVTLTPTATATITDTPTSTATSTPEKPCGDADDDGAVSSLDALSVLQFAAGLINSVPNPSSADVNSDGSVDSLDALLILQFVVGSINMLNCP